jgi:hypothetical protein
MTNGGPGYTTRVLSLEMYQTAFSQNEFGYAIVLAVVLGVIGVGIALGVVRFSGFSSMASQQEGASERASGGRQSVSQTATRPVRAGSGAARGAAAPSRIRRRLSPGRVLAFVLLTTSMRLGAAFRIVRRSTRAAAVSFRILLLGLAIPIQAIIVPLYLLVYRLHLYDTLFALMLTMTAAAVPVSVLIMVSFVRDMPLGLTKLEGQYAINVPAVMAAALLSVLPLVVLFIVMRKQVMRSLGSVVMR